MILSFIEEFYDKLDICNLNTIIGILMIVICPITWNLVARYEFYTKKITKICGNNNLLAADIFAHILIEMGIFRNYMFTRTMNNTPHMEFFETTEMFITIISSILIACSVFIVAGSYWQLGIHGIYYADYFGILMDEKVTEFPYNILENPLYIGSQSLFFSLALYNRSPTGIFMFVVASIMYRVASFLENPMTDLIYSEENRMKVIEENKLRKLSN